MKTLHIFLYLSMWMSFQAFGAFTHVDGQYAVGTRLAIEASSEFTVNSTTKGWLPPRMTTTQRDLITSPATALELYNTTTGLKEYYNGSAWVASSGESVAHWLTGTVYNIDDVIFNDATLYKALTGHTASAAFETDLNNTDWMVLTHCPLLTTAQISGLGGPIEGDCVYDITTNERKLHNGSAFVSIVDISTAQTLTNKTIDADNNTVSNIGSAEITNDSIVDADVNSAAAIDASKIHDASVSNTEYGYLDGVTSDIQTQLNAITTMADGTFLIGNGSNVATEVTLSGDVTSTNAGVTAIGTGKVTSDDILNDEIVNADINSAAAILYSKLAFSDNIVAGDIATSAVESTEILDGTILDADVNASAAIDASKIGGGAVSTTEYDYLSTLASDVQVQIDALPDTGTADEITLTGTVIGLADNPILPGLEGFTLPSGTTAQRDGTPPTWQMRGNSTQNSVEVYNGSSWGAVGGGGPQLDKIFDEQKADQKDTSDFSTGSNAAVMGGGTITAGIFSESTDSGDLMDAADASVFSITGAAGDESLDYICSEAITIPQKWQNNGSGAQDIVHIFQYSSFTSADIQVKGYCVGDTSEVEALGWTPRLLNTDAIENGGDGNGDIDADEGASLLVTFRHEDSCDTIRWCLHIQEDITTSDEIMFNNIITGVLPDNRTNTTTKAGLAAVGHYNAVGSCDWTNATSTSFSAFATASTCTALEMDVTTSIGCKTWTQSDDDLPQIKGQDCAPGRYVVTMGGGWSSGTNGQHAAFGIGDGTTSHQITSSVLYTSNAVQTMSGTAGFSYTDTADRTWRAESRAEAGTHTLNNGWMETTFTVSYYPDSNLGVLVTGSQHMAGFYGGLKWNADVGGTCSFSRTSTSFGAFSQDTACSTPAGAVEKIGASPFMSSDISVDSDDVEYPQIKFSVVPQGMMRCTVSGRLTNGSNNAASNFQFVDSTNSIAVDAGTMHEDGGGIINVPVVTAILDYSNATLANRTNVTIEVHGKSSTGSITIQSSTSNSDVHLWCEYLPSDTLIGKNIIYNLPTHNIGGTERYRAHTGIYSTGETDTLRFTTVLEDTISQTGTMSSHATSATEGLCFTASQRVTVDIGFNARHTAAKGICITKNPTATHRDTSCSGFSGEPMVRLVNAAANLHTPVSSEVELETGETVCTQGDDSGTIGDAAGMMVSLVIKPSPGPINMAHVIAQPTCYVKDVKAVNTNGGSTTLGSYQTRDLNTLSGDCGQMGLTLASDAFTIPSGTYTIDASAPAYGINKHKIILKNTTDSLTTFAGQAADAVLAAGSQTSAFLSGQFTITKDTTFEIQHRTESTRSGDGFGKLSNWTENEVYTIVKITQKR